MQSVFPFSLLPNNSLNARLKCCPQSKVLVVSAQNFRDGGPWTILTSLLPVILNNFPHYIVLAIVGQDVGFSHPNLIQVIETRSKSSWLVRLWFEKFAFYQFSKGLSRTVSIWLALHDVTPRVLADSIITYYHNPAPFWRPNLLSVLLSPSLLFFRFFYLFACSINIYSNKYFICQQFWLAATLRKRFPNLNILVSSPLSRPFDKSSQPIDSQVSSTYSCVYNKLQQDFFLCPVTPRVFKRIEIALKAFSLLPHLSVLVTISPAQNLYTRYLFLRFSRFSNIHFIGYVDSSFLEYLYSQCKAVVFPSELETWGLPISESMSFRKTLFLPDLPYARETVGTYTNVCFYQPSSSSHLLSSIQAYSNNSKSLSIASAAERHPLHDGFIHFSSWQNLLSFIL